MRKVEYVTDRRRRRRRRRTKQDQVWILGFDKAVFQREPWKRSII